MSVVTRVATTNAIPSVYHRPNPRNARGSRIATASMVEKARDF
jgi:hypothetical protein